jgi:PAS domain S-box-containing protein
MWIYDLQTLEILDVNDAAISQYGYSRDAFLKMRLTDLHPPKYEAPSPKPVDQATNIVESSSWRDGGQWRHVLHDGRIIDVHILAHPVEFSGRQTNFIAAQNITAQVQAEADLRAREAWWRALIEHSADMIAVVDRDGKFLYVSPSVERILGYSANELSTLGPFEWLRVLDDHDPKSIYWRDRLKTGQRLSPDEFGTPLEIRIRNKAGTWYWLEVILTRLVDVPAIQGVVVNAREITARVEAEKSLFAANENLQALIRFAPTPIIAQDRQQRVTVWNPAAEKLFGWREAEVLGQPNPVAFTPVPVSSAAS